MGKNLVSVNWSIVFIVVLLLVIPSELGFSDFLFVFVNRIDLKLHNEKLLTKFKFY